jgi:uncharacterized protein
MIRDIAAIAATAAQSSGKSLPPVHLWDPPFCGDIDMRIASDGTWFYQGTPVGRPAMVRLFASILRKDADSHVLVTPVEKVGIKVDDAPFLAVELEVQTSKHGQSLHFRSNVDDWVTASAANPIQFEREITGGLKPYVLMRAALRAKVTRSVYLELVALAVARVIDGVEMLGVESEGAFFPMATLASVHGQCHG